ncbi:MAG: SH3 domain-containing protein [Verrucomicrobiae bacterium]|nr:SH3 domain-containing protein [Verrucomicrobiae bacterium]
MKANYSPLPMLPLSILAACTFAMLAGVVATAPKAGAGPTEKSALSREPGAIYLEDILDKPVTLKVKADSSPPVFSRLDAKLQLGRMVAGTEVTIDAVSEKAYRVRGKATHGGVVGWMSPKYLETKDPEFFEKMKKAHERYLVVEELIAAKEVGLGMTPAEVERSLGKPTASRTAVDKDGSHISLEFTTYEKVPQTETRRDGYGRLYNTTIYVKVPVGKLVVQFTEGAVTRIEEEIGPPPEGGVKIVPAPIVVY